MKKASDVSETVVHSTLFPMLFEHYRPNRQLKILDVGAARPETVEFFTRYNCRLYIADLFEDLSLSSMRVHSKENSEPPFPMLSGYPTDEKFDICLFWDFLNYLDKPLLDAFNTALQPFIHQTTQAHAFSTLSAIHPLPNLRYSIQQIDQLSTQQRSEPQPKSYPRPQAALERQLSCLNITRSRLLHDGRSEILMRGARHHKHWESDEDKSSDWLQKTLSS